MEKKKEHKELCNTVNRPVLQIIDIEREKSQVNGINGLIEKTSPNQKKTCPYKHKEHTDHQTEPENKLPIAHYS